MKENKKDSSDCMDYLFCESVRRSPLERNGLLGPFCGITGSAAGFSFLNYRPCLNNDQAEISDNSNESERQFPPVDADEK